MNPAIDQGIPLDPPLEVDTRCIDYLSMLDNGSKPKREMILTDLISLASCMSINARLPDHLALCVYIHTTKVDIKAVRKNRVERMVRSMSTWNTDMDAQLVRLLNNKMKKKGINPLTTSPFNLRLSSTELLDYSKLQSLSDLNIRQRFALLKLLNHMVDGLMAWIDFKYSADSWSIAAKLQKLSHTIFFN